MAVFYMQHPQQLFPPIPNFAWLWYIIRDIKVGGGDFSRRPPFPPPRPIIQFFFSSYSRREKARQKPRGKNCSCQLLGGSRRKSKTLARRLLFGRVRMQQQQYPRFPMPPRSHKKPPRSSFRDINDFILEADGVYRPFGIFTGQS